MPEYDVDTFLSKSFGGDGESKKRAGYLKNWHKGRGEQTIRVWLHTGANMASNWAHPFPRYWEDRKNNKIRVQSYGTWVCHETDDKVLNKAKYRDADGNREYPPKCCPMDLAMDWVNAQIVEGKIGLYDVIFRFEDEEERKNDVSIMAGEFAGAFASKYNPVTGDEWSNSEKEEMRKHGISVRDAYKTAPYAQCKFIFRVVVKGEEREGCQIAKEAPALGKKMQEKIGEMIKMLGSQKGNPLRTPYPFEWSCDNDKEFSEKYKVIALPMDPTPPEVLEIITDNDPPDIRSQLRPFKPSTLRYTMERAAVIKMPFDEFFEHVKDAEDEADSFDPNRYEEESKQKSDSAPKAANAPTQPKVANAKAAEPEPEYYVCDHCEFDKLLETDKQCPKCKTQYEAGNMIARPCANCGKLVDCEKGHARCGVCASCGAEHDLETWKATLKFEPPKTGLRRRAGGLHQAAASASPSTPTSETVAPRRLRDPREVDPNDDLPYSK